MPSDPVTHPTPDAGVNAVLRAFLAEVQKILASQFTGLYLHGSLALGDFDPQTSDIDFLVVTVDELPDAVLPALEAMHVRLAAGDSKWGSELEGSYIPQPALRRYDPAHACHPHIERGGRLRAEQHDTDWVVQRHVLREHGVVVAGPALHTLIDPVAPDELRLAVLELLHGWWAPMLRDSARLHHAGYQAYAVLTMCRVLYTLRHGTVVSKPVAAQWAKATLDRRWPAIIERALAWRPGAEANHLNDVLDLIRYTVERSRHSELFFEGAADESRGRI